LVIHRIHCHPEQKEVSVHYGKTSKTHADARTTTFAAAFAATADHAGISHAHALPAHA
jgi:hypothetical protein